MSSTVKILICVLPGVAFFLAMAHDSSAQLPFSFKRNFITEESFCIPLEDGRGVDGDDIAREITRFGEEPLTSRDKNMFRVIDYSEPDNVRSITIRTLERRDTLCIVTIKTMMNPRKGIVFVHRKTYGLEKWNDFQVLAKRYFREDDKYSTVKTYFPEGAYQRYELLQDGKYHVLSERQTGSNGILLRDYLEYLLSPIFDDECTVSAPHVRR